MRVVIFGAAGFIGTFLRESLKAEGIEVLSVVRDVGQAATVRLGGILVVDVAFVGDCINLPQRIGSCAGVIYSVGHCPSGTFDSINSTPLHQSEAARFESYYRRLVFGLRNVFQYTLPAMTHAGNFIVIGSAITRLTNETCPPWLHAADYASAQAAQAELVKWMRRDSLVKRECLNIHRLALGPVEGSPFFDGSIHPPPAFVSQEVITRTVFRLLRASHSEDVELLPEETTSQLSLPS